ncbi:MAG: Phosphatidylinositol phosphate synthase @ Archaetidylinositol phosphate synthase [uncultured Gemmatimonadetes bacterium]|uniref:Phosphatidylinositol phosphate synthase @ Archaetidylinositol phosphate synthase n=1 Tax=uncultured Gemmatimonadota bacterium TaxID=203437 RepID=A0A6J4KZW5_9BACT|nr:MAG: Phosphatidylinositol phosphate synthase @ Archaetidylinositol phosphate synthase [uncultured Gemmatimonadota bacterium]
MKLQPSALRPLIAPLIERPMGALGRMGVNPNVVTTLGFLVTVSAGLSFFLGNIRTGGALVLLGGVLDMVDGAIARAANLSTKFGSFYDSTLDRASEVVVLIGVMSLYLGTGRNIGEPWMVYLVVLALSGSLMVSYTRARAEGLGIDCKVGLMQRAERIILLGGSTLLFGSWRQGIVLTCVIWAMAVLTNATAMYRIYWVYRHLQTPASPASTRSRRASTPANR